MSSRAQIYISLKSIQLGPSHHGCKEAYHLSGLTVMAFLESELCLYPPSSWRTCYAWLQQVLLWARWGVSGLSWGQELPTWVRVGTADIQVTLHTWWLFIALGARDQHHQQQHPNFTDEGKTRRGQAADPRSLSQELSQIWHLLWMPISCSFCSTLLPMSLTIVFLEAPSIRSLPLKWYQ